MNDTSNQPEDAAGRMVHVAALALSGGNERYATSNPLDAREASVAVLRELAALVDVYGAWTEAELRDLADEIERNPA